MLTLIIEDLGGLLPGIQKRSFSSDTITIGRGEFNDVALADPSRLLSKSHCGIRRRGAGYELVDTSTNGVFVNDASSPVGRDQAVALQHGDRLRLGNYLVKVEIEAEMAEAAPELDDFAQAILGSGAAAAPQGVPCPQSALRAVAENSLAEEELTAWPPEAPISDPAPPTESWVSDDWLDSPPPVVGNSGMIPDRWWDDQPVLLSPAPQTSAVQNAEASPAMASIPADAELADPRAVAADSRVEALFLELVRGLQLLMRSRDMAKNELRVQRTVLGAARNNPFKYSADLSELMAALIHGRAGFADGETAIREFFKDVRIHQQALMMAAQEAVAEFVRQFDPTRIEKRGAERRRGINLLAASEKARCWDGFCKLYEQLSEEANKDISDRLSRSLADYYERAERALDQTDASAPSFKT